MFDAQETRFRSIRLRSKQASCAVCGENPTVTQLQNYETFCGSAATDKVRNTVHDKLFKAAVCGRSGEIPFV